MKSFLTVCFTILSFGLVVFPNAASAQNKAKSCDVKVLTPLPGDRVGKQGRVRGTAKIPPGTFLWVFAHMKDLVAEWWPQGGRAAVIGDDGSWVIIVGYGGEQDIKEDFEVAVVVVDANTNATLRQYFVEANKVEANKPRDFKPIEFPGTIDGCPPIKVTVNKTSH